MRFGPSQHAKRRLWERWGVWLDYDQWAAIIRHARQGTYSDCPGQVSDPGCVTIEVPMGSDPDEAFLVPMVVDLREGVVITVLPLECSSCPPPHPGGGG